jgi:hypothetical protein
VGKRGRLSRYAYWSDRRIQRIASDSDIVLESRLRWTVKSPAIPFFPEFEFGQEARTLRRAEVAQRIEAAVGAHAVEDFVTPSVIHFAKGRGRVSFAQFAGVVAIDEGVVLHTSARSSTGARVEICLFGTLSNMADYAGASDKTGSGWVSSAAPAIHSFLISRRTINTSQWDDPESLSVEALKIAQHQGITGSLKEHEGKPWTRGFTLSHADDSEWFAEIYSDVILDKIRWKLDEDVDRILIGAPLWVRTPRPEAVTRYRFLRQRRGSRPRSTNLLRG